MRVLLATEAYWPINDGGSVFERNLVKGLRARGHDLRVVAPSPARRDELDETDGYPIYRAASLPATIIPTYRFTYHPAPLIRRAWAELRPELVHIHNPYAIGRTTLRFAKHQGIPALATNHLMPENVFYNLHAKALQPLIEAAFWRYLIGFHNRADFVTSPSETARRFLLEHGLRTPSQAVTNGIETERYKPRPKQETEALRKKLKLPTDRPTVLYLGRLDREKRLDVLIQAIPEVLRTTPAHLVLAGRGNDRERIEAMIRDLKLEPHITFTGFVPDDEKPLLYNLATLFAFPSPSELQGIVALEAIASGLPLVCVRAGALPELCHDGENGRLSPVGDPAAFAQAITEVLTSPKLEEFGQESRRIAEGHAIERMLDGYESIYRNLVGHTDE